MTCVRCEGLMVPERFQDILDDTGQINFMAWHCLNCGEIVDHLILANRRNAPEPTRPGNRNLAEYR